MSAPQSPLDPVVGQPRIIVAAAALACWRCSLPCSRTDPPGGRARRADPDPTRPTPIPAAEIPLRAEQPRSSCASS